MIKTGGYVSARLVLGAICGAAPGLFMLIIGMAYWLALGIWTGLVARFVPTMGTYIAIAAAGLRRPRRARAAQGVAMLGFALVYQQVENVTLEPRSRRRRRGRASCGVLRSGDVRGGALRRRGSVRGGAGGGPTARALRDLLAQVRAGAGARGSAAGERRVDSRMSPTPPAARVTGARACGRRRPRGRAKPTVCSARCASGSPGRPLLAWRVAAPAARRALDSPSSASCASWASASRAAASSCLAPMAYAGCLVELAGDSQPCPRGREPALEVSDALDDLRLAGREDRDLPVGGPEVGPGGVEGRLEPRRSAVRRLRRRSSRSTRLCLPPPAGPRATVGRGRAPRSRGPGGP